jgi:valyl-tRNA synthetase
MTEKEAIANNEGGAGDFKKPENLPEKFLSPYEPNATEDKIYQKWLDSGFFNPDICIEKGRTDANAETFSIVLPPPNVTGVLHTGHAAMLAIEDTIVRYQRMRGKRALWIPGTDHAAIATQSKVEKELSKQKIRRHDLGREEFLKKVDEFAQNSHDTIVKQVRKMGSSVDWSREAFTLDDTRQKAVFTAFKKMYDDRLIYRGNRIVNWDPKGQTTISDDEIIRQDETTNFYYLKYGPFVIGTARPETKFGDKYVVMHPDDKRYAEYSHGQKIDLEWINGPITATIIKDSAIDMEFGTGVMTITPWHDATDFEIAERHNLDKEQIIDKYGKLLPVAGEFEGMKITEAREKIIEKLQKKGLVDRVDEKYEHAIATAERTGGIVEPQIMRQWFVDVNKKFPAGGPNANPITNLFGLRKTSLKKMMLDAVRKDGIEILPDRFEKTYFHWIENLRDWCISRQIWYGHRVPVWYKGDPQSDDVEMMVSEEAPDNSGDWVQDEDTLDTWFSSGLWTFSTLGWPDETADLRDYHPTNLLETGYDIIFFWVARMILMSKYFMNETPFKTVYLHGLVRDGQGRKMSKSLGNALDPVDLSEKYGADALRMALLVGVGPGNDLNLGEDKIRAYKKFSNKIWNASRFVLESVDDFDFEKYDSVQVLPDDQKKIAELKEQLSDITDDLENYRLYLASEKLYHYFWHTFADIIIEESKEALNGNDSAVRESKQKMLYEILTISLKALHPFIPFITEEIWSSLPHTDSEMLLIADWPSK